MEKNQLKYNTAILWWATIFILVVGSFFNRGILLFSSLAAIVISVIISIMEW